MCKNLEEFDCKSFENSVLNECVINEELSLLIESNPPFGLDYEEVNKNIHLLANPPFGVDNYDYKG